MSFALDITEDPSVGTPVDSQTQVEKIRNKLKLSDLKVSDLKIELEKRDLDRTGVKSVLLERLKNALLKEGEDPDKCTFDFVIENANSKSPLKKKKVPSIETNGEIENKESVEGDKKDDLLDGIEGDIKDEEIEGINENFVSMDIDNEINDKGSSNEVTLKSSAGEETDKSSCNEVALELSMDEEEVDKGNSNEVTLQLSVEEEEVDKGSSNEVTLQLSIDEEEAQLNEDESILEISKPPESEIENPSDDNENKHSGEVIDESSTVEKEASTQNTSTKSSKLQNEEIKDKKKAQPSKSVETANSLPPKVLKVLGKSEKIKNTNALAKSLWITGLPNTTRAFDLKALFSKQGRVLSVKIVKSTKQTPGKCYGFVTMASSKDASKAIQNLHRTELNGRTISVERTQNEPSTLLKKSESKLITLSTKKQTVKKEVSSNTKSADISKSSVPSERKTSKQDSKTLESKSTETLEKQKEKNNLEKSKIKGKEYRSQERRERDPRRPAIRRSAFIRPRTNTFNERPRFGPSRRSFAPRSYTGRSSFNSLNVRPPRLNNTAFSFQKIREERLRLREEREIERRRLEEITRHRYIERKQREEAYRLEREKEKLRLERELLERERAEILKLEREKQRLERERLEREREELRRQSELTRGIKRPVSRIDRESEQFWDNRKKPVPRYVARTSFQPESSSTSRYEFPMKVRPVLPRQEFERRTDRYNHPKPVEPASRLEYENRDSRRDVIVRARDERQVYDRNVYRAADRGGRSSFQDRERHSTSKRENPRVDWKHDRRVHERVASSTSNSAPKRMYY